MIGAGEQFGRYLLRGRLAFGGMAEIFLAELRGEEGFARRLVIKRILPQYCADSTFVRMFIDEAVLAARISHPNVVQVIDFGHVDGVYFLAMELVDGVDLRRILAPPSTRPTLTAAETAAIGEAAARGLAFAHSLADDAGRPLNLVHRDVSPHNILIARTGEVKLTDFGIAKAEARVSRTGAGMIKGKLSYMSPEQAAGRSLDQRSDQFSLGIVLWECLAGRRLFGGGADLEVLRRVVECEVQPLAEVCPAVPGPLADAVDRCLAREPERRWPNLGELADALAGFRFSLGAAGAVHLGALVPPAAPSEPPRRTLALDPPAARHDARPETPSPLGEITLRPAADRVATATLDSGPEPGGGAAQRLEPRGVPTRRGRAGGWVWAVGMLAAALVGIAGAGAALLAQRQRSVPAAAAPTAVTMLRIESTPAGARLLVGGRDTGLVTPVSLPLGDPEAPLALGLAHRGYVDWQETVWPGRVRGRLQVVLTPGVALTPAEAKGAPAAPAPRHAKAAGSPRPRSPRPVGRGFLSLRTTGAWVEVYLGERKLGTTPLHRVELPAGRVRLRLVNPLAAVDQQLELEIVENEELRRTVTTP